MGSFPTIAVSLRKGWRSRAMAKVAKTLRSLGDHLQVGASVRNVYRVSWGFGPVGSARERGSRVRAGGSGGGAGMSARPVGALEITEVGTRFIPFVDPARLGIALIVGFLIGLTVGRGPAQRRSVVGDAGIH